MQEGNNIITAAARNAAGKVGTASITVTLDTTPPRVTIDSPRHGAQVTTTPITVAGIVNDIVMGTVNGGEAQVTCNGLQGQVANRRFVVSGVPLTPGPNVVTCVGTDRAGNADSGRISVTLETAAARITMVSGDRQVGQIGALLPAPLVVSLTQNGAPVAGKPVLFKVLQNDGILSAGAQHDRMLAVNTDANGQAAVQLTLGTWAGAGNSQVQATAPGFVGEVVFSASGLPAVSNSIVVDSGSRQQGVVGQALPRPFAVVVIDRGSNRLSGGPVTFTVVQGGGNFAGQSSVTVTTDSDGRAPAVLTLGLEAGFDNNVVEATFPGNPGRPASFVASGKNAGNPADTTISGVMLE